MDGSAARKREMVTGIDGRKGKSSARQFNSGVIISEDVERAVLGCASRSSAAGKLTSHVQYTYHMNSARARWTGPALTTRDRRRPGWKHCH